MKYQRKRYAITLNIDGEVCEIRNELAELRRLLEKMHVGRVQYAEKIYNIEHINEANFGFVTGKRPFNEQLTRAIIEAIQLHCLPAQKFLERVASYPEWEKQSRISDKAKEIIAYSCVGVIGIQLSKLMAIGKEDQSLAKPRKYLEKCLHIAKRSLSLVNFALLSKLWDAQALKARKLTEMQKQTIRNCFNTQITNAILNIFRNVVVADKKQFHREILAFYDQAILVIGEAQANASQQFVGFIGQSAFFLDGDAQATGIGFHGY